MATSDIIPTINKVIIMAFFVTFVGMIGAQMNSFSAYRDFTNTVPAIKHFFQYLDLSMAGSVISMVGQLLGVVNMAKNKVLSFCQAILLLIGLALFWVGAFIAFENDYGKDQLGFNEPVAYSFLFTFTSLLGFMSCIEGNKATSQEN